MGIFKQVAQKTTTLSELMAGREQLKTEEVISRYPDGVTIMGFDVVELKGKAYPVVIINEDETVFFNGGTILNNIVMNWITEFDGDLIKANERLRAEGGVKIKMSQGKTKDGNNITKIDVL